MNPKLTLTAMVMFFCLSACEFSNTLETMREYSASTAIQTEPIHTEPRATAPQITSTSAVTNTAAATDIPTVTSTKTPQATFTPAQPSPTITIEPGTSGPAICEGENLEMEPVLTRLINAQRSQAGLNPVSSNSSMAEAARNYSRSMAEDDFFDHGDIAERLNPTGSYSAVGEILYAGKGADNSASAAIDAWLNSPIHRGTMLNPIYTILGVGYWCAPDSVYGGYFTVDFATP